MGAVCGVPPVAVMAAGAPGMLVRENGVVVTTAVPVTVAVTVNVPAILLAVSTVEVATPDVLVVDMALANEPVATVVDPADEGVKVTDTPATGLPLASLTVACSGWNPVLTAAVWGLPPDTVIDAGGPALLSNPKVVETDGVCVTIAVTVTGPKVALAVIAAEVAMPEAVVVAVVTPFANVTLAPVPGVWNVTPTLGIGFPPESFTITLNGDVYALPIWAPCPLPPLITI
jgi:hypothetical protein